jgi:hypothetical protein
MSGVIVTETHTDPNLYLGQRGGTPRIIFGGSTTYEIDNLNGSLRFFRPGALSMILDSAGKVGIGTSAPDTMLDINECCQNGVLQLHLTGNPGGIQLSQRAGTSAYLLSTAGYQAPYNGLLASVNADFSGAQLNAALPSWAIDLGGGFDAFGIKVQDAYSLKHRTVGGAWANLLNVTGNGNVGIGTTGPDTMLDINECCQNGVMQLHLTGNPGGIRLSQRSGTSAYLLTTAGFQAPYNGLLMSVNADFNGTQLNTALPSWAIDLGGGFDAFGTKLQDTFALKRRGVGGAWTNLLSVNSTGLTVSGNIVATGSITGAMVIGATYQDVAEWVPAATKLDAGTVVVLNPDHDNEVMESREAYDTRVAGVVSAKPGVILGTAGDEKAMIATTGRVRVRVDATHHPVHIGDLLVTSETAGTAMVSEPMEIKGRKFHQPGTVIGKALESLPGGRGEILVLLSLQ